MSCELLGCAFCGAAAAVHESLFTDDYRWIKCEDPNCGFTLDAFNAPVRGHSWAVLSAEQLAARWNTLHRLIKRPERVDGLVPRNPFYVPFDSIPPHQPPHNSP